MKKSFLLFSLIALSLGLTGCNNQGDNSNSNSNSNNSGSFIGADGEVSFSSIMPLFKKLLATEISSASSATIVNRLTNGTSITTTNEEVEVYNSEIPSSASSGTVVRTINGQEDKTDTFVKRNAVVNETYEVEVNGLKTNQTYPMFAQIVDFENENMGGTSYQDSAARYFVVESDDAATSGGLTAGSYVTTSDLLTLASTGIVQKLNSYFNTYVYGNIYAQQVGVDSFEYRILSSGNIAYSCIVGYSIEGDLDDTQFHSVNIQFVTDANQEKLLNAEINYVHADMREGEDDDAYVNEIHWEATLKYETRKEVPEDAVNVRDYFLQEITDIEIYTRENNNAAVDPNNIIFNKNYTYLFGRAKSYLPAKTVDVSITSAGSSNQSVVSFDDDGYFEIVGPGTATLSFVYFGKDSDGVYREKVFNKDVTITLPAVESIKLTAIKPTISKNTLLTGETYTFSVYALPSTASQEIEMTNMGSSVVSATIDENNNVTLNALKEGSATILFRSKANSSISIAITFTVISADSDFSKIITTKTYSFTSIAFNYTLTLSFSEDNTGTLVYSSTYSDADQPETHTYTFTYSISGTKITFNSWSDDTFENYCFEYAMIANAGDTITCSSEAASYDYEFNVTNA